MYKKQSKQATLFDFDMPLGMELDSRNRWIRKADEIPWDAIEQKYAELFPSHTGNVAKPLRLALGALLIQTERRISDIELVLQIQETPCLQYFCGLPGFTNEPPFDSTSLVNFRKRLTAEILSEINELIIAIPDKKDDQPKPPSSDDNNITPSNQDTNEPIEPTNKGTLICDATCAPQNIRYPQDLSILDECRRNLEKMIDKLHAQSEGEKPRTYRRKARKQFLSIAKKKSKKANEIRKAIRQQLGYVARNIKIVEMYLSQGKVLPLRKLRLLQVIIEVYNQQFYMYRSRTHSVSNRIVSLHQPWVRPIVRGKARVHCEFGAKLDVGVTDGWTRLEHLSFDAYNESANLIPALERYKERHGHYPEKALVDQIYRNKENIKFCKTNNITILGKPLGRPQKYYIPNKKQIRKDEIARVEVERKIAYAKGCFGMQKIMTKLQTTSRTSIMLAILAMNIKIKMKILLSLFWALKNQTKYEIWSLIKKIDMILCRERNLCVDF